MTASRTGEPGMRARRVAIGIQRLLSGLLVRDARDPELAELVLTQVSVSDDLGIAWVKVRLLAGGDDEKRRTRALSHLRRAGTRLRRALGHELSLKRVPELRFDYDEGADRAQRVESLLAEIASEKKLGKDDP